MKYMLLLRFPPGAGPQPGTPELDTARSEMLRRTGDGPGARAALDRALALTANARQRAALRRRAAGSTGRRPSDLRP
ncbi:MAG TPA: hypothetical protein VFZ79_01060 [Acidimicrobiales bacterium]